MTPLISTSKNIMLCTDAINCEPIIYRDNDQIKLYGAEV